MVESIPELRKICQKRAQLYNKKGVENTSYPAKEYIYDRFLRLVSIYITKVFLYTPITSNQVSLLSMVVGVIAGIFFSFNSIYFWLGGFLSLQLFHFLDAVDGEIARYRQDASPIGKFFDVLAHNIVIAAVFIGISVGTYNSLGNPLVLVVGSICVALALLNPITTYLKNYLLFHHILREKDQRALEGLTKEGFNLQDPVKEPQKRTWRYTFRRLAGFDGLPFIVLLLALLDLFIQPFSITIASYPLPLNFKFLFLMLGAVIGVVMFLRKLEAASKFKKKYFG